MLGRVQRFLDRLTTGEVVRDGARRLCLVGRDGFKYTDGERSVLVETEMLAGPVNRVIYAGLITHWLPPHEAEVIPRVQAAEIVQLVQNYLAARGRTVEVDWQPASDR